MFYTVRAIGLFRGRLASIIAVNGGHGHYWFIYRGQCSGQLVQVFNVMTTLHWSDRG